MLCHFGRRAKLIYQERIVKNLPVTCCYTFIKRRRKTKTGFVHTFNNTVVDDFYGLLALFFRSGIEHGNIGIFLYNGYHCGSNDKYPEEYQ